MTVNLSNQKKLWFVQKLFTFGKSFDLSCQAVRFTCLATFSRLYCNQFQERRKYKNNGVCSKSLRNSSMNFNAVKYALTLYKLIYTDSIRQLADYIRFLRLTYMYVWYIKYRSCVLHCFHLIVSNRLMFENIWNNVKDISLCNLHKRLRCWISLRSFVWKVSFKNSRQI